MNDLGLRISGNNGKRTKTVLGIPPVKILKYNSFSGNEDYKEFMMSQSSSVQLSLLKDIVTNYKVDNDMQFIEFVVAVFFEAEPKHPIKSFVLRFITKTAELQDTFSMCLSNYITSYINNSKQYQHHKEYESIVVKLAACSENFPTGYKSLKMIEKDVLLFLVKCCDYCTSAINSIKQSPTERNEIFDLVHCTLRLQLYMVQKLDDDKELADILNQMYGAAWWFLNYNSEVPMDTLSVCGLLVLTTQMLINGSQSWLQLFKDHCAREDMSDYEISRNLSIYSAIAKTVPIADLEATDMKSQSVLLLLYNEITFHGKSISKPSIMLGVARTVAHLSKQLAKLSKATGHLLAMAFLEFAWAHLDHHMDSVRHLAAQVLDCAVTYCATLHKQGEDDPLISLLSSLRNLDRSRKGFYVAVASLARELGSEIHVLMPGIVHEILPALSDQAVQAKARYALEALLQVLEADEEGPRVGALVRPLLQHSALEALIARPPILRHLMQEVKSYNYECSPDDLEYILRMAQVIRRSTNDLPDSTRDRWKGLMDYRVLGLAAIDACDEVRLLSLSVAVESPKTTEPYSEWDFEFLEHFLKYNINAQSPHFRQTALSILKKWSKRIEGSMAACPPLALERIRQVCFASLTPGANYSRRHVALQLLLWLAHLHLPDHDHDHDHDPTWTWNVEYVASLMAMFEDSYETNRALALDILDFCPHQLIEDIYANDEYVVEKAVADVCSAKPTEAEQAAYKLVFVKRKLTHRVIQWCRASSEHAEGLEPQHLASLALSQRLLSAGPSSSLPSCLHALRRLLGEIPLSGPLAEKEWVRRLVSDAVLQCCRAASQAAELVALPAPEGHQPTPDQTSKMGDRSVSAQMSLLRAWRTVKEGCLTIGEVCGRAALSGEEHPYMLEESTVSDVGSLLFELLVTTRHRGAFEQVYLGFTMLLQRLWKCRGRLSELPKQWADQAIELIKSGSVCQTRRSAGLPHVVCAVAATALDTRLLSSHLQLLQGWLSAGSAADQFVPAANVLRVLFRSAALVDVVGHHVGRAFHLALDGFHRETWPERNAATLLLSELLALVFGARARRSMTGRIFFLRYPNLYGHIMHKLEQATASVASPSASLFPVLLLLSRLYPSSLEGTVSNLELAHFVTHVKKCARSPTQATRLLAARALRPLLTPFTYLSHIEALLGELCNKHIERNYCHGVLLQLNHLIEEKPDDVQLRSDEITIRAKEAIWILRMANTPLPCYMVIDEYIKLIYLLLRFGALFTPNTIADIRFLLHQMIFKTEIPKITSGREVCLSNALYLYIIIMHSTNIADIPTIICKSLQHNTYEIQLTALNYILIVKREVEIENNMQKYLGTLPVDDIIFKDLESYVIELKDHRYLECRYKALVVLRLLEKKENVGDWDEEASRIMDLIDNAQESLTAVYLGNLTDLFKGRGNICSLDKTLRIMQMVFVYSMSGSNEYVRFAVLEFIESFSKGERLNSFKSIVLGASIEVKLELMSLLFGSMINLLEDYHPIIRQRMATHIKTSWKHKEAFKREIIASKVGELLVDVIADGMMVTDAIEAIDVRLAVVLLLALMRHSVDAHADPSLGDENKAFDQNERYNMHMEEFSWTKLLGMKMRQLFAQSHSEYTCCLYYAFNLIRHPTFRHTFDKFCDKLTLNHFLHMNDYSYNNRTEEPINPKIYLLYEILK